MTHRRLTHWSGHSVRGTFAVRQRGVNGSRSAHEGHELTGASLGDVALPTNFAMLQRFLLWQWQEWRLGQLLVFDSNKRRND